MTKGAIESYYEPEPFERKEEENIADTFAVVDTETNWNDEVMSIGVVVADFGTKEKIDSVYYIIDLEYNASFEMLSKDRRYSETHNVVLDAEDELQIMRLLGHGLSKYDIARI